MRQRTEPGHCDSDATAHAADADVPVAGVRMKAYAVVAGADH